MKKIPNNAEVQNSPILLGDYSLFSILAFVLGFIFWPLGLVFGIITLSELKKYPYQINVGSKYLAWVGILIQPILFLIGILLFNSFLWRFDIY